MRWNPGLALVVGLAFGLNLGCAPPEQVQNYRVKKDSQSQAPAKVEAGPGAYRIVGALFPADNPVWYFKAGGPTEVLMENQAGIDAFLNSLTYEAGAETAPSWKLPVGWKEGQKRAMTYAVLQFGSGDKTGELTVSQVGGGMKANLERWAGQLGMKPDQYTDINKFLTPLKAGALPGYRVDMAGPNDPATKRGPFMGGR